MIKSTITIRTATSVDAAQIAFVHINTWRSTYRGIVSDEYLNKLKLQERANSWNKELTKLCDNVFVADHDGEIIGFASSGEGRDNNNFDSELYAIYVLEQYQQKNIGKRLLIASSKYLQTCGHSSMYVWVLAENNSKQFYQRLGGQEFGKRKMEINGQQLTEIAYGWKDLNKLINST